MISVDSLNDSSVTYCTGLWLLTENRKHGVDHYFKQLERTCQLIAGERLVLLYAGEEVRQRFSHAAQRSAVTLESLHVPVEALPMLHLGARFVRACQAMNVEQFQHEPKKHLEKGFMHRIRDYEKSGVETYKKLVSIWVSKIALVCDTIIEQNPFGTSRFSWIDASIARFAHQRSNWNFSKVPPVAGKVMHYQSPMRYKGVPLPINASFLSADIATWQHLNALFQEQVMAALQEPYAHDEETVLGMVFDQQPALFHAIGAPHRGGNKVIGKLLGQWLPL